MHLKEDLKFIWGIKSYDDLSGQPCCIDTMNDIEIVFNKNRPDAEKYSLWIETIYHFPDGQSVSQQRYIKRLFDGMTKWMVESGWDVGGCDFWDDCGEVEFDDFSGIYGDSVEAVYGKFKRMAEKFCEKGNDK